MKTCKQCGKELMDEAVVCPQCGCQVDNPNNAPAAAKSNKKLIGIIVGAVAVVVAVVIALVLLLGGSSYEDALDKYLDALFEGDYDAYLECCPEEYWEKYPHEKDKREFEENIKDFQEEAGGASVSYEVTKEELLSGDEYDEYCEVLVKHWGVDENDIGEIYSVEVTFEIDHDDYPDPVDDTAIIAEIRGEYYLVKDLRIFN